MASYHRTAGYCVRVPLCDASVGSEYFSIKSNDVQSNLVQHKIVLRVRLPFSYLMIYIYIVQKNNNLNLKRNFKLLKASLLFRQLFSLKWNLTFPGSVLH